MVFLWLGGFEASKAKEIKQLTGWDALIRVI